MPNTIISPLMNMPVPVVSTDPGPDWATNVNACLSIIDGHNHTPGSGSQLTPNSLNINTDLPMNNNNLISGRSVRFSAQPAALSLGTDVGCLYEAGVDLYYNDGSGNQIRLTQSGSIVGTAGSITGLPSGTASASYAAGTFVFQSATNTSAVLDGGSLILRDNTASSKGLTLSPPNAMAADYGITLPSLPASQKIMTLDNVGNMSAPYVVDNSTIVVSSNTIKIPSAVNLLGVAKSSALNLVTANTNAGSGKTISILLDSVNSAGSSIGSGVGVSPAKIGTGEFTIGFTSPFFEAPAVVGNVIDNTTAFIKFASVTTTGCTVTILNLSGVAVDASFSFLAVGQRV